MDMVQRLDVDLSPAETALAILDESAPALDLALPDGAVRNEDGTVSLTLAYPVLLSYRIPGGPEAKQESWSTLTMRRLNGRDMRQVIAAKGGRAGQLALARSANLSPAKIALLHARMDASDITAANNVVAALCGFSGDDGLPETAVTGDDGRITLPLALAAEPDGFEPRHELVFRRLKGEDLIAISQSKDVLSVALARATDMKPAEANAVFDAMDAADIMAMQRVIGFLSGSGRKTGG